MMLGSSPRVRGKLSDALEIERRCGLIPACAGKTTAVFELCAEDWAHPRVCGENFRLSSWPEHRAWLIPACAGKTR